ncbi:HEAT repeat domain-containing protein [Streptomyces ipomoeae]|uniref:HEAT repeat domain-containing protein n=1 Tax=Streptomyces ipomoeae TaxID=103232 RepID=UPI0002F53B23|nr:HEAT repeat domain-containing protein [Streptomyces ipomoeae]MDX2694413.1 HEAT repeat domain-containing protein [Streptomyces ipomoeae]MDX2838549.1 HEAT repeat domain-containing protein [Streptomyces ipomoeae]
MTVDDLLRAVDGGSADLVSTVFHDLEKPLSPAEREAVLSLARRWYEAGAEAELRRRTGASGPAGRARVMDDEYHHCEEITLGGVTVRDGHAAILTWCEEQFEIRTPFEELVTRALAFPDRDHMVRWQVSNTLGCRWDDETWSAVLALRAHPDHIRRLLAMDVLFSHTTTRYVPDDGTWASSPYEDRAYDVFAAWVEEERHPLVLPNVLVGLVQYYDPRNEAVGLRFAGHADPEVRGIVPGLLESREPFSPAAREALCALMRDPSTPVRCSAVVTVAEHPDPHPALRDALAERFGDEDEAVRVMAVFGLAERDDPRCVAGRDRMAPVEDPERYGYGVLDATQRYEERRDGTGDGWRWRRH